jgi:hypothetical protein
MNHKQKLKALEPWAHKLSDLYADLEAHCETLTDDELRDLGAASNGMAQTNCWWAAYHVAPIVREAVGIVSLRRLARAASDA